MCVCVFLQVPEGVGAPSVLLLGARARTHSVAPSPGSSQQVESLDWDPTGQRLAVTMRNRAAADRQDDAAVVVYATTTTPVLTALWVGAVTRPPRAPAQQESAAAGSGEGGDGGEPGSGRRCTAVAFAGGVPGALLGVHWSSGAVALVDRKALQC